MLSARSYRGNPFLTRKVATARILRRYGKERQLIGPNLDSVIVGATGSRDVFQAATVLSDLLDHTCTMKLHEGVYTCSLCGKQWRIDAPYVCPYCGARVSQVEVPDD